MKKRIPHCLLLVVLAVAATVAAGCKLIHKPASASFASVQIQGHTPEQIRAATVVVFQQEGYSAVKAANGEMVFEKEGSRWDQIAYGNWVDDAGVWVRVRASVVPGGDGAYRLQCQAYRVRNKGDAVFEEEARLKDSHSKPFQTLLDKVARQMGG